MYAVDLVRPVDSPGRVPAQTSLKMGRYEVGSACRARARLLQCSSFCYMWYAANRSRGDTHASAPE